MAEPSLNDLYDKRINVADGGLGTTLQDAFDLKIAHTPLWSTRAAVDDEKSELLLRAHLSFLRAGARTILTSTYQAAFDTFEREGYSREQALQIMSNAISTAARARAVFCAENANIHPNTIRIVLSLGTFGSTVSPMQDFDGIFPPPYGPKAYSATEENTASFGDDVEGRERSIEALAEFHAERLLAYTQTPAWTLLDGIAFETVPVAREVIAIRHAVARVVDALRAQGRRMKPWWLTAVFPDAETHSGVRICAKEVASLMVRDGGSRPNGIGFNCVAVDVLHGLLDEFAEACAEVLGEKTWPWLVMKPNGGGSVEWSRSVAACVDRACGQGWGGLIVGGCCSAGPVDISRLAADRGYLSCE